MVDKPVVTELDTYRLSKLTAGIINQVKVEVQKKVNERTRKARKKWEEVVTVPDGTRYAAVCRETEVAVVVKSVRLLHKSGKIPMIRR